MAGDTGVPIELGGKTRTLKYTNLALIRMEEELAKAGGDVRRTNACIWAGLLHERPAPTLEQVIDWLDPKDYETVAAAVEKAINLALGVVEG